MTTFAANWFEPAKLFENGYPRGLSSALRELPSLRQQMADLVTSLGPGRILEVGPGDCPIVDTPSTVYLDLAPEFLTALKHRECVVGDIRNPPFAANSFDVAVASDVLTHIVPADRPQAVEQLCAVASSIVLFNPQPGTPEVSDSVVPTAVIEEYFRRWRPEVRSRYFRANTDGGPYEMAIILATTND